MVIVEEVGLITCERGVIGQRAKKRKRWKSRFRKKWKMGETNEECEARVEERSNAQAHDTWMR